MIISPTDTINQKIITNSARQHPQESAKILEQLPLAEATEILQKLCQSEQDTIWEYLPEDMILQMICKYSPKQIVHILKNIKISKAARIFFGLASELQGLVSRKLPKGLMSELNDIMQYPLGTAGSLMDHQIITFYPHMSVAQAINKIKEYQRRGIRILFIIDDDGILHSMLTMQTLMMAENDQLLDEISKPIPAIVSDMDPQDEIVAKLEEQRLTDIPVVNIAHQFIGVVRHHTLIQATKDEISKDIQKMVGVSEDERALSGVLFAVRRRLPWLEINLLTAFLAAAVVGLFESTIAQFTALAVLLPVVAGQSGNTGAQALAVTMRGLALKEIQTSHWFRLVFKELKISFITGICVSITTSLGVLLWSQSMGLTLVIALSMILSMMLASISGALVPIVLKKLNQDPASSSSIILTTVTDVCGFFSFLGIATMLSSLI